MAKPNDMDVSTNETIPTNESKKSILSPSFHLGGKNASVPPFSKEETTAIVFRYTHGRKSALIILSRK